MSWPRKQPVDRPITGTVISRSGATYQVRTAGGRVITAASAASWAVGIEVVVLAGQIIGAAGRAKTATVYEV